MTQESTIVLVHGAWHSAMHWERVRARLDRAARHSVAIDLPAHGVNRGQRGADVTLDQAAEAVLQALRQLGVRAKPILVGHSLAGPIITRAAEKAPALIERLVYVSAHLPIRLKVRRRTHRYPNGTPDTARRFLSAIPRRSAWCASIPMGMRAIWSACARLIITMWNSRNSFLTRAL